MNKSSMSKIVKLVSLVKYNKLSHQCYRRFSYFYPQINVFLIFSISSAFYLMYARLEEDHGLARHAMAIYDRATKAVLPEEQFEVRACVSSNQCRSFKTDRHHFGFLGNSIVVIVERKF